MFRYLVFLLLFSNSFFVLAQINNDSLFINVKKLVSQNQFEKAINEIKILINNDPLNIEYQIYLARLYFWSGNAQLAKETIINHKAIELNTNETIDLLIQIELKNKNADSLLYWSEMAKNLFPQNQHKYLFYIALAHEQKGNYKLAIEMLNKIPSSSEYYNDAQYLKTQILQKQKFLFSVGIFNIFYNQNNSSPQAISHAEFGRKGNKNTILGRVNYGMMFNTTAIQFECDDYFKINSSGYAYINLGFSNNRTIFPEYRIGAEYYFEKKNISSSLGVRWLYFNSTNNVKLFTGHLGYFLKPITFNYRPFVLLLPNKLLTSHLLYIRKNFKNYESYIQFDLQYGALPYFFYTNEIVTRLSAYRAGLTAKFRLYDNLFVQPIFMYEWEEYFPQNFRNRYIAQLIIGYRF